MRLRTLTIRMSIAACLLGQAPLAAAQDNYPSKPIRLITPATSKMPIINPNTPNKSEACEFIAASPMNIIIEQ